MVGSGAANSANPGRSAAGSKVPGRRFFSLADITLYAYVHRAGEGGFDLSPFAAVRSWCARIEERPADLSIDLSPL